MTKTNNIYESALYALLDLGVEIESDEMLDIVKTALNGQQLATKNNKRVAEGKRLFDSMFDKSRNEDQLLLLKEDEQTKPGVRNPSGFWE